MEHNECNAAIYARSACEEGLNIENQIRACKAYADRMGWRVDDANIYADTGVSGATTNGRPGLSRLIDTAQRVPQPFTVVLMRDSSRLGRNLIDVSRILGILWALEVSIYFVDLGLEASSECVLELLTPHTLSSVFYLERLSRAVRRGQAACVASRFIAGRRCFGYDHVPVVDITGMAGGRPMMIGVKPVVNQAEAANIRRIFELRGEGLSLGRIASLLNAERVPSPKQTAGNNLVRWTARKVHAILHKVWCLGRIVYGHTRRLRHPQSGKTVVKHMPQVEWRDYEAPERRIVTDDQWHKAHGRHEDGDTPLAGSSDPRA